MSKKLYVGNLPFQMEDEELKNLFGRAGQVVSARLVLDPATGRKRGFGFVEMSSEDEAQNAVNMFNGNDIGGRNVVVDIARERERSPRPHGGGGGGGDRDYGGGGGGGGGRGDFRKRRN